MKHPAAVCYSGNHLFHQLLLPPATLTAELGPILLFLGNKLFGWYLWMGAVYIGNIFTKKQIYLSCCQLSVGHDFIHWYEQSMCRTDRDAIDFIITQVFQQCLLYWYLRTWQNMLLNVSSTMWPFCVDTLLNGFNSLLRRIMNVILNV